MIDIRVAKDQFLRNPAFPIQLPGFQGLTWNPPSAGEEVELHYDGVGMRATVAVLNMNNYGVLAAREGNDE